MNLKGVLGAALTIAIVFMIAKYLLRRTQYAEWANAF